MFGYIPPRKSRKRPETPGNAFSGDGRYGRPARRPWPDDRSPLGKRSYLRSHVNETNHYENDRGANAPKFGES